MFHRGKYDLAHGKLINDLVQAAYVVRVGMGADHIVKGGDAGLFQIGNHSVRLVIFTCINEHIMSV